jgi:iron complex transport system substrate-binding protein
MVRVIKIFLILLAFCLFGHVAVFATMLPTETKREVIDMAGRRLQVPHTIKKVVPLGGANRFMVYLKSLDLVVGMEAAETKWISAGRPYGLVTFEKAKMLPIIGEGGPGKLPDFEKIITVWPDIILAMGMDIAMVETIQQKTGIPVFILSYGSLGTIDIAAVKEAIQALGRLLNRNNRAQQLVDAMGSMEKDLQLRSANIPETDRPQAYVGAISYMGTQRITSTESHFVPLSWAGGRNVADEIGQSGHLFIDPEKLLFWNPDNIFLDAGGLTNVTEDYRKNPEFYLRLKAVQQGKVFLIMPYNNYHTNIEIALADAYFIGKSLYPTPFKDIDPAAKADEIFSLFLGITAYEPLRKEFHGFGQVRFEKDGLVVY